MIDKKLEQLKTLKNITLTSEEKSLLRASVARSIQISRCEPKVSIFYTGIQHGLRMGLSTFLFIVFVGGSVSVIADNSLPGDPLYSFKINVNEEVKGSFIKSPDEKLSWEKTRIDNRLNEIKTLAVSKTLTKAKQETAQRALNIHIEALSKEIGNLSEEKPSEALKVTAKIEKSLSDQKEDLKKSISKETTEDQNAALKAIDGTIKKVSDQETKIISKELDKLNIDVQNISQTAEPINPPLNP
jgi:hypothetical protein